MKDNPHASRAYIDGDGQYRTKWTAKVAASANILLTLAFTIGYIPVAFLGSVFFGAFLAIINVNYQVLAAKTYWDIVFCLYNVIYGGVKTELREAKARYFGTAWLAVQVDLWTDRLMVSYICLNGTFVNKEYKRVNRVLASRVFAEEAKTAENIQNWIEEVFNEYGISSDDISMMVADGGEKSTLQRFDESFAWMVCVCHEAQRCVAYAVGWAGDPVPVACKSLKQLIDKFRKLNNFVRNSTKQLKRFDATQRDVRGAAETTRRPKVDGETRWWSTHEMLSSNLADKPSWIKLFSTFARDFSSYTIQPLEWVHCTYAVALLTPMRLFVSLMEGTNYCTVNLVIRFTLRLRLAYAEEAAYEIADEDEPEDEDLIEEKTAAEMGAFFPEVRRTMSREVERRFFTAPSRNRQAEELLVVAAFLDVSAPLEDFATYTVEGQPFAARAPVLLAKMMRRLWSKIQLKDTELAAKIAASHGPSPGSAEVAVRSKRPRTGGLFSRGAGPAQPATAGNAQQEDLDADRKSVV